MNFRRFLYPESICLELRTSAILEGEPPDEFDAESDANLRRIREGVLREITDLMAARQAVANPNRLYRELYQQENKAASAIGQGIALPHVRTLQVRSFVMAFGRSSEGLPFAAPDGEPIRLFFGMAAPRFDDKTYLRVYRSLAKALLRPGTVEEFLAAKEPGEILRTLRRYG